MGTTWKNMLERNRARVAEKATEGTVHEIDKRPEFADAHDKANTDQIQALKDETAPKVNEKIWTDKPDTDESRQALMDSLMSIDAKRIVRAIESLEGAIRSKARSIAGEQYVEAFEKRNERRFEAMLSEITLQKQAVVGGMQLIRRDFDAMRDQLFERIPERPAFEAASTDAAFQTQLDDAIASKRKFKIVVEGEPERLQLLPTISKRRNP